MGVAAFWLPLDQWVGPHGERYPGGRAGRRFGFGGPGRGIGRGALRRPSDRRGTADDYRRARGDFRSDFFFGQPPLPTERGTLVLARRLSHVFHRAVL